jgi:hypothetical protein
MRSHSSSKTKQDGEAGEEDLDSPYQQQGACCYSHRGHERGSSHEGGNGEPCTEDRDVRIPEVFGADVAPGNGGTEAKQADEPDNWLPVVLAGSV